MKLEVYSPPKSTTDERRPVVIFWHGGTWQRGGLWRYQFVGRAFARMGVVAVLVGYRKYPQVKYPVFVDDAVLAVRWVRQHIHEHGGDTDRLFIAGHSAGCHTAAALLYRPEYWQKTGLPRSAAKGFIGLAGPYDFSPRPDLRKIFPMHDPSQPWRIGRQLPATLAPACLIHGYFDPIVDRAYTQVFAKRLRQAGGEALTVYRPIEHLLPLFSFIWPLRLLPWSTWRATRKFIHQVTG